MNRFIKKYELLIVAFFLFLMLFFEIFSALGDAQTMDEGVHISAGYSYWRTFDFRMNPEHPLLIKYLSAIPLLFLNLNDPESYASWHEMDKWKFASDFIYHNNVPADLIIFLSRLPIMILSLLLGVLVYIWAKKLFGLKIGCLILILYAFCPNILANSRLVTTDLGVAFFFALTIYYFGKYLKNQNNKNLLITAVIFGLAQLSKFSAIILLPILIILYFIRWWQVHNNTDKSAKACQVSHNAKTYQISLNNFLLTFLMIIIITSLMIFIFYGFEIKKPLDDPEVLKLYDKRNEIIDNNIISTQAPITQMLVKLLDPQKKFGGYINRLAKYTPIPAYSFLRGSIQVAFHNSTGHTSYLFGKYSDLGRWYYFPISFLIKAPITILIFIIASIILFMAKIKNKKLILSFFKKININFYCLLVPIVIYFLWSLTSHLNLGVRHILPIYPLLYILFGYSFFYLIKNSKLIYKLFLLILFIFYIFNSLNIFPFYLSFFNEIVGGPKNGHKYLLDSNIDWGQDLIRLKKYIDSKSISTFYLKYFGSADINYYFPKNKYKVLELPKQEEKLDDIVAISITDILSKEGDYKWLLNHKIIDTIGYSIYIINTDFDK